jgi:acyl carrier protein
MNAEGSTTRGIAGDAAALEPVVRDVLAQAAGYARDRELAWDTPLADIGLDSFGLFEFVLQLESRLGLEFSDAEFTPESFESLGATLRTLEGTGGVRPPRSVEGARPDRVSGDDVQERQADAAQLGHRMSCAQVWGSSD